MKKTYKIKPLQWETTLIPTDQYGEGWTEHSANGTVLYFIHEDSDGIGFTIYDDAGDFIRFSSKTETLDEAIKYCEAHYIDRVKRNLIELT